MFFWVYLMSCCHFTAMLGYIQHTTLGTSYYSYPVVKCIAYLEVYTSRGTIFSSVLICEKDVEHYFSLCILVFLSMFILMITLPALLIVHTRHSIFSMFASIPPFIIFLLALSAAGSSSVLVLSLLLFSVLC